MSQHNTLEVITQQGWNKEYPLTKGIIHIGSALTNDIRLDEHFGGGVAPLQVQLITVANGHTVYKLINMGETDIAVGGEPEHRLRPHSFLDLTDGLQFKLGDFTLVFHSDGQEDSSSTQVSRSIGLELAMPNTQLGPHQSLEGVVTVSNLGQQVGARFDLALDGLEPDCYDLAPGPLLSSGAEKEVLFRLHHRGHKPLAGKWRIVIRATAPETYPGEQATVSQIIEVLPYYHHGLNLAPAKGITTRQLETAGPIFGPAKAAEKAAPAKPDKAWELPVANNPAPALTFNAGPPPSPKAKAQAQPVPAPETIETWWSETATPPQPESEPAEEIIDIEPAVEPDAPPPAATELMWERAIETELVVGMKPAQKLELATASQKLPPVRKEEEEKWWDTP